MISFDDLYKLSRGKVNLTGGNPYTAGADFVKEAAIRSILSSQMGLYPPVTGDDGSKKKAIEFMTLSQKESGMGLYPTKRGADNVIFASGVTQLWHSYVENLKRISDEKNAERRARGEKEKIPVVIMPELTYGLCLSVLDTQNVESYGIPLREDKGYHLQPEDIKETIEKIEQDGTHEVMCIKIDNPHNPTGAVLDETEVRRIAELCCKKDIRIFDDLVYFGLGNKHRAFPFGGIKPEGKMSKINSLVFTAYSLSKGGGFPAMRIGVGMGAREDIRRMSDSLRDTTLGVSSPSLAAITEFIDTKNTEKRESFLAERRLEYQFRGRLMRACIEGADKAKLTETDKKHLEKIIGNLDEGRIPGIKARVNDILQKGIRNVSICNPEPESGFFYLMRFSDKLGRKNAELAKIILENKGPFVLPADFFKVKQFGEKKSEDQNLARVTFSFEKPEVILVSMVALDNSLQAISNQNKMESIKIQALAHQSRLT